jgi:hypothetical protein
MTISLRTRRTLLAGALAAAIVASVWPRAEQSAAPQVVAAVTPQTEAAAKAQPAIAALPPSPRLPERATGSRSGKVQDLFTPTDWNPPPPRARAPRAKPRDPVVEVAVAPAPPAAPPFQYVLSGTLVDSDGALLVFAKEQETFVVRIGEVLDRQYRVEGVDARAITLTYLPLNLMQRIPASHAEALSTPFEAPQFAASERSAEVLAPAATREDAAAELPAELVPQGSSLDRSEAEIGLSN